MPATQLSETEVDVLISRISELEAQLNERDDAARDAEHQSQIASLRTEYDGRIAELQRELDAATLTASRVTQERDDVIAYLQAEADRLRQEEEREGRAEARLAVVREVASFPDDYIERHRDRWIDMDDAAFEACVADWRALPAVASTTVGSVSTQDLANLPLTAAAERRGNNGNNSPLRGLFDLVEQGVDIRAIGATTTGGAR